MADRWSSETEDALAAEYDRFVGIRVLKSDRDTFARLALTHLADVGLLAQSPAGTVAAEAAEWVRDERDAAEARLIDAHDLLDRLDQTGQDLTTDTIRAVLGARGRPWAQPGESSDG